MGLMRMQFVVAVSENDVIGRRNQLPWRLSADLRRFKSLTLGKPILMGRKTYESIGHALPGRLNLVLSRSSGFAPGDCTVVPTLDLAREAARAAAGEAPLMVIGGAEIFRQCAPEAECISLDPRARHHRGWRRLLRRLAQPRMARDLARAARSRRQELRRL